MISRSNNGNTLLHFVPKMVNIVLIDSLLKGCVTACDLDRTLCEGFLNGVLLPIQRETMGSQLILDQRESVPARLCAIFRPLLSAPGPPQSR